jgi:hypothetical protein
VVDAEASEDMMGGRRRRRMRGGMYDNNMNPAPLNTGGSRRRQRRRGGGVIATAALPFGLFGLQKLFQGRTRSASMGNPTRKMRRSFRRRS